MDKDHQSYRKLIVWQKADELAFQVYTVTKSFPHDELFGLTSQMRRAAVSVPANIVEGYARTSKKGKIQFYNIASASLSELEYYIDFCLRLGYLSAVEHQKLANLRDDVGRLLYGFIRSTKL